MTIQVVGTTVEILGKSYQLKCSQDEIENIQRAAEYLENKMQEIRDVTHLLSIDRIAVLAALTISQEYISLERDKLQMTQMLNQRLLELQNKIESFLTQNADTH